MKLSAFSCISRGLVNLRANWELIPVQLLQGFLVGLLILVGLLPPLAAVGWSSFASLGSGAQGAEAFLESLAGFMGRGGQAWLLLTAGLVMTCVIWLIAGMVYCYFQAGIYGILRAGDRQAPTGRAAGWQWFRTFSARDLRGFGSRYLWRYFWFFQIAFLVGSVLAVLFLAWVGLVTFGESRWGATAAMGIGCGGLLPMLFVGFVLAFWSALAQADLPHEDAGVWVSARRALTVVGRRLGALVLFAFLGLIGIIVLASGAVAVSLPMSLFARSSLAVSMLVSVVLNLLQWIASSTFNVVFAAVMTALMRSETGLMEAAP